MTLLPRCTISSRGWRQVTAELDRVSPDEGLAVPLVALTMRQPDFNPCAPIELEDIDELLIAATVLVPADRQVNRLARVSVLEDTDARVNRSVERLVSRFPRLRACAYLHSHPFARGSTRPSRGLTCDVEGHMVPLLDRNSAAGLNAAFSFIACREERDPSWKLQAFALDRRRQVLDLGFTQVVPAASDPVRAALVRGLSGRAETHDVLRRWRGELELRGLRFELDELFDGWVRTVIHLDGETAAVALIPIDFPRRLPSFFTVCKEDGRTRPRAAPGSWLRSPEGWAAVVDSIARSSRRAGAREAYFARVIPLIGIGLEDAVVSVEDVAVTARVVELLASCMLRRVIVRGAPGPVRWPLPILFGGEAGEKPIDALDSLRRHLAWKNGFVPVSCIRDLRRRPRGRDGAGAASRADLEIAGELIAPDAPPRVVWDVTRRRVTMHVPSGDLGAYLNLSYGVARQARDVLLGRAPWPHGLAYLGSQLWPFTETAEPLPTPERPAEVPPGRHVMVIGAGSVGSELVRRLRGTVARWTLVDEAKVSIFNPQRQWYGTGEIGENKVDALARRLAPAKVRAVPWRLTRQNAGLFEELLDADRPHAAVLATGTSDDACLAEILRGRGIPHVVAYAYPGARFFEVTVVEGSSPCLHCYRGNLYRGIEGAAPMSDEVARFLYRESSEAEREKAYVDLVAEPATAVETGRIADVAALCLRELLCPPGRRSVWFHRLFDAGTTCLLGGNVVEDRGGGETAYGLTRAGQVVRLGLEDILGTETLRICPCCGRRLRVVHELALPEVDPADADAGLLESGASLQPRPAGKK